MFILVAQEGGGTMEGNTSTIKWTRLKRIAQEITGKQINLHCSTSLEYKIIAAVTFGGGEGDIALNLNRCKNIKDVLNAIAHEMAHIMLNSEVDDNKHKDKWTQLNDKITRRYFEEGPKEVLAYE